MKAQVHPVHFPSLPITCTSRIPRHHALFTRSVSSPFVLFNPLRAQVLAGSRDRPKEKKKTKRHLPLARQTLQYEVHVFHTRRSGISGHLCCGRQERSLSPRRECFLRGVDHYLNHYQRLYSDADCHSLPVCPRWRGPNSHRHRDRTRTERHSRVPRR